MLISQFAALALSFSSMALAEEPPTILSSSQIELIMRPSFDPEADHSGYLPKHGEQVLASGAFENLPSLSSIPIGDFKFWFGYKKMPFIGIAIGDEPQPVRLAPRSSEELEQMTRDATRRAD